MFEIIIFIAISLLVPVAILITTNAMLDDLEDWK